jgi:exodeoxyribonuclease VII small subunit
VTARKSKIPDFEHCMAELEALVERLEHGDLPLEESLKQFERGVVLARACQTALKAAEQKVEVLLKPASDADAQDVVEDFEPES